jgi:hypothetical protein
MDLSEAQKFIVQIRTTPQEWQNVISQSPKVHAIWQKYGSIDKMNLQQLADLKVAIQEVVSVKIRGVVKQNLDGLREALVGRSDTIVPMTSASFDRFQPGRQLDGVAIRGAILAGCECLPKNMFLVDELRFRRKEAEEIAACVDTLVPPNPLKAEKKLMSAVSYSQYLPHGTKSGC